MDWIQSRAFWTLVLGITPPILTLFGVTDDIVVTCVLAIVGSVAGYFGVTAIRSRKGEPRSYAALKREMDKPCD